MAHSSLASVSVPASTSNYTYGRTLPLRCVTIHHMAGVMDAASCGRLFQNPNRQCSSHYGIGVNGEIGVYVEEENTSWCNSNWNSNCESVTIETSNCATGGDWPVSDASYNSLIRLVADIAKRNGLGKLVPGDNLTWHSMFAATQCVPIDTELLTKEGWKRLEDIQIGDEVASASLDGLKITFEEVYDKVPVRTQDTYSSNELTATKDHRIVYSTQNKKDEYRIDYYRNILNGELGTQAYIPLAGTNENEGLKISDDMIRFLIAVQADGSYMKGMNNYLGVCFHFKKERKVERIKQILDNLGLEWREYFKSDGTVTIKVRNEDDLLIVEDLCETYLDNKVFSWKLLNMNSHQARLFLDELLLWDGSVARGGYSSSIKQNIDVVNAICALNNQGSKVCGDNIIFRKSSYKTFPVEEEPKRNKSGRLTQVSCVSVKTGLVLVRQNGRTFIIGNCPGPYLLARIQDIADKANQINYPNPTPTPTTDFIIGDEVKPIQLVDYNGTPLYSYHDSYIISDIRGDRAVLTWNGIVWAALNTNNLQMVNPAPRTPKVEWKDTETTVRYIDGETSLINLDNDSVVKKLSGEFIYVQESKDGIYVRTSYSKEHNQNYGIEKSILLTKEEYEKKKGQEVIDVPVIEWIDVEETTKHIKGTTNLINIETGEVIKELSGNFTYVQISKDNLYVRTSYSKVKGLPNGIRFDSLDDNLEPQEPTSGDQGETPVPIPFPGEDTKPEVPNQSDSESAESLLKKILDVITSFFNSILSIFKKD